MVLWSYILHCTIFFYNEYPGAKSWLRHCCLPQGTAIPSLLVPRMSSWSSTMASSQTMRSAYFVVVILYDRITVFVPYYLHSCGCTWIIETTCLYQLAPMPTSNVLSLSTHYLPLYYFKRRIGPLVFEAHVTSTKNSSIADLQCII
uniref:Uncharacterized protein n=1 Tax=Arundo donax TaxID=35708 RepID=A0A0A9GS87_ARUDO